MNFDNEIWKLWNYNSWISKHCEFCGLFYGNRLWGLKIVYDSWKLFCVVNFWLFSVRILRHSQCGATEAFDKRPKVMLLSEIIPGLWLDDDKGGSLLVIIVLFLSFPCRRRVSCSSINICTSVIVQQQYIF